MVYRLLRFLFSLSVRAFFKRIEVEGVERIPAKGPVLLLPNHPNGLVDPFLILIHLKRPVSLTAKWTLTKNPFIALLFRLGKVVPIHRRQDLGEGADPSKNEASLAEVRRRLAEGGAVCLFPEGISHNQPGLQPLKTGAARIALEYVDGDGDPGGLLVFPIGLDYVEKQRFRSSVLVRVGEPIPAGAWRAAHPGAEPRDLMDEVEARLKQISLSFEKRKESIILGYAARLLLTQGAEPASVGDVKEEAARLVGATQELQARYEALVSRGMRDEAAGLGARIRAYAARLGRLGMHPREVYLDLHPAKALWFVVREGALAAMALPLACIGVAVHAVPYAACWFITQAMSKERDNWATFAIFSSVFVFPLWYGLIGAWLWLNTEAHWWLGLLSVLPLCLAVAIRFRDRFLLVLKRTAAFVLLVLRPGLRRELRQEGRAILGEIELLSRRAA